MSLVDWSKYDEGWKWVTRDLDGVTIWGSEPKLYHGLHYPYYVSDRGCLLISDVGGSPIKEPRPTNPLEPGKIVEDKYPPAIIPTVNETLNLLDYLLFESESELSSEDRLKIVDHMRVLSKALKEWENY